MCSNWSLTQLDGSSGLGWAHLCVFGSNASYLGALLLGVVWLTVSWVNTDDWCTSLGIWQASLGLFIWSWERHPIESKWKSARSLKKSSFFLLLWPKQVIRLDQIQEIWELILSFVWGSCKSCSKEGRHREWGWIRAIFFSKSTYSPHHLDMRFNKTIHRNNIVPRT